MPRPQRDLKVIISERKGGYDPERLFMAFSLLISEKDFIDYFLKQPPEHKADTAKIQPRRRNPLNPRNK